MIAIQEFVVPKSIPKIRLMPAFSNAHARLTGFVIKHRAVNNLKYSAVLAAPENIRTSASVCLDRATESRAVGTRCHSAAHTKAASVSNP
jgi:hypothetical protein